jgi:nitrous oxidase accessory protein NosD
MFNAINRTALLVAGPSAAATVTSLVLLLLGAAPAVASIVVDPNATPCVSATMHYTTVQAAVSAAPSGSTISVCPATYPEQVTITRPLTLKGVTNTSGNTGAAVITIPNGTFASSFTQVTIRAANVTLNNIGVDGSNGVSGCSSGSVSGILFDSGSSGMLKQVALRNQNVSNGSGGYCGGSFAVYATSAASVTVTDSSVRNYDGAGIQLTATTSVTVNTTAVTPVAAGPNCIYANAPTVDVASNTVVNCGTGVYVTSTVKGTVAANTVIGTGTVDSGNGIFCFPTCTALTISGNTVFDTFNGMSMKTSGGVGGVVFQNNDISGTVNAVYLFLQPGNTVSNNTITDATVGVYGASGNTLSGNAYRVVMTLTQ